VYYGTNDRNYSRRIFEMEYDLVIEVLKELQEEYCIEPVSYEFLGYLDLFREMNGVKTHWISLEFLVEVDREKVKNGEPHKFEALGWFRLGNLPTPAHSTQEYLLRTFKDKLAKFY
jgi:hypothetical protein